MDTGQETHTAQKMTELADLVTFTEEIFNEKPHFLCSIRNYKLFKFGSFSHKGVMSDEPPELLTK